MKCAGQPYCTRFPSDPSRSPLVLWNQAPTPVKNKSKSIKINQNIIIDFSLDKSYLIVLRAKEEAHGSQCSPAVCTLELITLGVSTRPNVKYFKAYVFIANQILNGIQNINFHIFILDKLVEF